MPDEPGEPWNWCELDSVEIARKFLPRFPAKLEEHYKNDTLRERRSDTRRMLLIAIGLFNAGIYSDYVILHEILRRSLFLHLCVYTPFMLLGLAVILRCRTLLVRDLSIGFLSLLSVAVSLLTFPDPTPLFAMLCVGRSIVVIMFGTLMLRQGFLLAVLTNIAVAAVELATLRHDQLLSHAARGVCLSVLISGMTLSVLASLVLERSSRVAYLLLRQAEQNTCQLLRANMELAEISHSDGLTGLSNRRHFNSFSQKIWEERRQRREETFPVSVIMVDIDHFKRLNDTHGHLAGDEVLIEVAKILKEWVRTGEDIVARFGGEEFVLMLPGIETGDAIEVAERIVEAVRHQPLVLRGKDEPVHVTISCGVSTARHPVEHSVEQLLATADAALYESKRTGRDRVRWHSLLHTALS